MAATFIRRVQEKPLSLFSDGTYCYMGTNKGKIIRVTISGGARTVIALVRRRGSITALAADSTYLYAGDNRGRITRIKIAGDAANLILVDNIRSPITGMYLSTILYFGCANGKVYSNAIT